MAPLTEWVEMGLVNVGRGRFDNTPTGWAATGGEEERSSDVGAG